MSTLFGEHLRLLGKLEDSLCNAFRGVYRDGCTIERGGDTVAVIDVMDHDEGCSIEARINVTDLARELARDLG